MDLCNQSCLLASWLANCLAIHLSIWLVGRLSTHLSYMSKTWMLDMHIQTQNPVTCREAKTLLHSWYNGDWKKENGGYQAHLDPIWRLEQAQQTKCYLPLAHRTLWSECPSEEDWHFRHFPVWVWTSWPNPRPCPSVLPNIYWETSANMAARCLSCDQAVGLGRSPVPDGWICGINRTEDLTCTAVNHWRRRRTCILNFSTKSFHTCHAFRHCWPRIRPPQWSVWYGVYLESCRHGYQTLLSSVIYQWLVNWCSSDFPAIHLVW